MAASPRDLTTLSDVREFLGITGTTDDVLIQRLITSASDYIQSWLNRSFAVKSYTQKLSGNGGYIQSFSSYPVLSVSSVIIDGITINESSTFQSNGYVFDEKFLFLKGYRFNRGCLNVTLIYSAGYSVVPFEISQTCVDLVSLRYKERTRIGEMSKSLAGEVVTYSQKDFSLSTRTILNNYKKVIPV